MIVLTSTYEQKNNEEENNITLDIGKCENILKDNYNISENESLYILQLIYEEEGMKIPKLEYEVYYDLYINNNNLTKLNLSLFKGEKVEITIKVKINDIIDKYNASSNYYNDICYKTTSECGTDIPLKTRRNEFVDNNMTLCEENCDLIDYNYNKEKAKCSCNVKLYMTPYNEIKFNKNDFFKSFIDIKNILNLKVINCYKIAYKAKNLINNYGFYLVGFIIVLYFLSLIIFVTKSYNLLIKEIFKIIIEEKRNKTTLENKIINIKPKNERNKKIKTEALIIGKNILSKESKIYEKSDLKFINKSKYEIFNEQIKGNYIISKRKILNKKGFEINSLSYELAIKLDHRTYIEYYISLLKNNHSIIFSFVPFDDYNSKIIKMFLFFFSFSLDFTINALFFTDDTMNKIYQDKGKFNFLYQIPQILYSTLISKFIDSLIKNFALTQEDIIQ